MKVSCASIIIDSRGSIKQDRQACEPEREGDRHAHDQQADEDAKQDQRGLSGGKNGAAHRAAPNRIRASSTICSPANTIQVTPATGQAT